MKRVSVLLPAMICLQVSALDIVDLVSEKDLDAAGVIAIGEIKPAPEAKKVYDQGRYIAQLRETLLLGLRSAGYTTTDGIDKTKPPDLLLEGAFSEVDNKGVATGVGLALSFTSYATGSVVLRIANKQSSFDGEFNDQIRNLVDEQGNAIVQYFRERKAEKRSSSPPAAAGFTCDQLAKGGVVFITLYSQQIRATAGIINVELQKWIAKSKVPMRKMNYTIDTVFQRLYGQRTDDVALEVLPEEILSKLKSEPKAGYCLLLYDFRDQVPGGSKERSMTVMTPVPTSHGMMMVVGARSEKLGRANRFNSIYCRITLFSVAENRPVLSDVLWADKEECGDEVVRCLVKMVKERLASFNEKKKRNVPCWK